jgi:hypothetical protein
MHTDIYEPIGIRTHDPSVRAGEDGSCLRPRGHCDRQTVQLLNEESENAETWHVTLKSLIRPFVEMNIMWKSRGLLLAVERFPNRLNGAKPFFSYQYDTASTWGEAHLSYRMQQSLDVIGFGLM